MNKLHRQIIKISTTSPNNLSQLSDFEQNNGYLVKQENTPNFAPFTGKNQILQMGGNGS